jgi:hypothetical protein
MRMLNVTLCILVLTTAAAAQAPARSEKAPGVSVVKTDWVYASTDSRQEAQAAMLRGDHVETGGGIAPTSLRTFPEQWDASVEVKNIGQRTIKSISLELVFIDAMNRKERLRYRLSREKGFGPGETVTLRKRVSDQKKGYYYVPGTNNKQVIPVAAAATRQVVVTRVEYADGAVWRP